MKVLCITQARLGSSRLPNKVLMEIYEKKSLIDCHMERVRRSKLISKHVIAVPDNNENLTLKRHCVERGYEYFGGSETDVLKRFFDLAKNECMNKNDLIVRLTGDCPLICPNLIDFVIENHLSTQTDYSSLDLNFHPRGFDVEVFTLTALNEAHNSCKDIALREHVTPFIYDVSNSFSVQSVHCGKPNWSNYRLCVDYQCDLELIVSIAKNLQSWSLAGHTQICRLLDQDHTLRNINIECMQLNTFTVQNRN